jgi:small subunit ribosomal protein S17
MADEKQNEQTENENENEQVEETVSAPEGPVAPAAEVEEPLTEEQPAEEPVAEEASAEEPAVEEQAAEDAPVAEQPAVEEASAEESAPDEPGAEEQAAEEAQVAEAEPAPDVEAEAAAAEAPAEEAGAGEAAAAAPPEVRRKPKRLPRSQRHHHSKPKRERPSERKPITRVPKPEHARNPRQERRGVVVSSAMDKTIVVRVDAVKAHPKYKKVVRRSSKFHAHDEQNEAKVGDVVRIVETRPLSKTKNWRLAEIVEVAQ